jgi:hypothetical protein
MRMVAGVVLAMLAVPVWAQELAKPGPEHELLKTQEGTWETTLKAGGTESKGTATYRMDLGGMWLVGDFEGDAGGMKFYGRSMGTYDARKKKFVNLWFDSMSATPMTTEGTYDQEKKTFFMAGEAPSPDGKLMPYRSEFRIQDRDTMHFSMFEGGAKEPTFTITFKRKK